MRVEGKVVLITGASEGIGAACAESFRSRGARLSLSARSENKLKEVALSSDLIVAADLTEAGNPERVIARTVERFGRVDVLVNNAGAGLYTPAHSGSPDLARRLFELNLFAPLELIRHAVPHMKRQGGGAIVNVSSIAGVVTLPWFTVYSATKSALISLTDGLRMELRKDRIHCMTVCPGYVQTNFQSNILAGTVPTALGSMRRRWAITPDACAEAIVRGLERDARSVVAPRSGWLLIALARLFPKLTDRRLEAVMLQHGQQEPRA